MITLFITPVVVLIMGFVMYSNPPKMITRHYYGYRTRMSIKSHETWDYSQRLSAIVSIYTGSIMLIITVIVFIVFLKKSSDYLTAYVITVVIQLIFLFLSYIPVEVALRKRFDKKGNPR